MAVNPLNEILYSKKQYDAGNKVWASSNANQYYGSLDSNEAALVKNMNTAQLTNYINTKNQTATPKPVTPAVNYPDNFVGPKVTTTPATPTAPVTPTQTPQLPTQIAPAKVDIAGNPTMVTPNGSLAPVDVNKYKTEVASIDDIAKKYGFDYSKAYANSQAEAEAQAKRNAYNQTLRLNEAQNKENKQVIDTNVYNAADALDQTGFQALQASNQNQSINGQNAGIAGDQNLRLAMNQQNQMGSIYGDANNARTAEQNRFTNQMLTAMEGLALTEQEKIAYADKLYNDRLQQGFGNAMQESQFNQSDNLARLQADLQQRGMNIGVDQFDKNFNQQQGQIDWSKVVDQANLTGQYNGGLTANQANINAANNMQQQQIDWGKTVDTANLTGQFNGGLTQAQKNIDTSNKQQQQQIDWNKVVQTAGLTGTYNGKLTADQAQQVFANDLATKQFNRPYEQLTKYEQAQVNSQAESNRIAATNRASSASSASNGLFDLNATQFDAVQKAYQSGDTAQKAALAKKYPELAMFSGTNADEKLFLQNLDPSKDTPQSVDAELMNAHANGSMTADQVLKYQKLAKDRFDAETKKKAAEAQRLNSIKIDYSQFLPQKQTVTQNVFGNTPYVPTVKITR